MGFGSLFCGSVGGLPDFTPIAQVDRPKAKPAHLGVSLPLGKEFALKSGPGILPVGRGLVSSGRLPL